MTDICSTCDRDLSTLPEEGCPHCGLEYDPLAPDNTKPLDFNKDINTEYFPEDEDLWDDTYLEE